MKKALTAAVTLVVALALMVSVTACDDDATATDTSRIKPPSTSTTAETSTSEEQAAAGSETEVTYSSALLLAYDENDLDATWDKARSSFITLADGMVRFDGSGAEVNTKGDKVTITKAGTYVVSGTVSDAQIVVDVEEVGPVRLVLNGADITCSTSAPVYVKNAEKVIVVLADGTRNALTDGASYVFKDSDTDEPNATLFSKTNLTINGTGSLIVTANYNDGITSKDDLKIVSGNITITAANDAVKGKDCLGVKEAHLTVTAEGDGLQATNDTEVDKGFICVSGGVLDITAGADGIQAETTLLVSGGELDLVTGGGSANAPAHTGDFGNTGGNWGQNQAGGGGHGRGSTTTTTAAPTTPTTPTTTVWSGETDTETTDGSDSAKALKAGSGVFIDGGTITIDSSDDSVHSNDSIQIDGGTLTLASGDDAIHADASVEINGGEIAISTSYEGIESNVITVNDGTIHLASSDDGINGVTSVTGSSATGSATTGTAWGQGGGQGGGMFGESGDAQLVLNGGYVFLDARGDGLDINGAIEMTGGTVIVNGPTESMNGALDYYEELKVTGGYLLAVGSTGMAEAPSDSSAQYSIMVNLDQVQAAGTLIHIQAEDGSDILTFAPTKQYQSVVLCSPVLQEGATYTVFLGGSCTGSAVDGLYSGGSYSGGTEYATLTISGMVTTSGAGGMMMPGGTHGGATQGGGVWGGGTQGGTMPGGGTQGSTQTTLPAGAEGGAMPGGGTIPGGGTPPSGGGTPPSGTPGGSGGTPPGGMIPGGSAPGGETTTTTLASL